MAAAAGAFSGSLDDQAIDLGGTQCTALSISPSGKRVAVAGREGMPVINDRPPTDSVQFTRLLTSTDSFRSCKIFVAPGAI